jgi:catalase
VTVSQFYRSDELVELIHENVTLFGGLHAGYRAVHADGRFYTGTFTATPAAAQLSGAAHFGGVPVPVTVRFSPSSGDPAHPLTPVAAMATRFYLPDGTVTDLLGITLPVFPVGTADDVIGLLMAARDDPATGWLNPDVL